MGVDIQTYYHLKSEPENPHKVWVFFALFVYKMLRFFCAYSRLTFLCSAAAHGEQYLALLLPAANIVPQRSHFLRSCGASNEAWRSLSRGKTASKNHRHTNGDSSSARTPGFIFEICAHFESHGAQSPVK